MSDEEDDYLSDKFLASLEAPKSEKSSISYAERRRVAQRESERKRLEGRIKSRREMEEEARREGLSRSLFDKEMEKASSGKENNDGESSSTGGGSGASKAMSMMLKMGFKPGEALGKKEEPAKLPDSDAEVLQEEPEKTKSGHLVEPLPLAVWAGRKGLGLGKRAMSPPLSGSSKVTKMSAEENAAEKSRNESFRTRARGDYEERRDEGRLRAALRTCANLDEAHGVKFNVLQLNPIDPLSIPPPLYDLLTRTPSGAIDDNLSLEPKSNYHVSIKESELDEGVGPGNDRAIAARLKEQMRADMLKPLNALEDKDTLAMRDALLPDDTQEKAIGNDHPKFDGGTVEAAKEYLQKNVQERLGMVLEYLRSKYFYCFWCGTSYSDTSDLETNCPGPDEDAH